MLEAEWTQIFLDHVRDISLDVHVKQEEGYKFEAVQHFQSHFDLAATNLAANLDEAILTNNLVVSAMYHPKKMLLIYAQEYPEQTRQALHQLFDESKDVGERINSAQQEFESLEEQRSLQYKQKPAHTYIGLRFLSLLLSYRYPHDYNPLKPVEWKLYARFIDPDFSIPNHTPAGEQYAAYNTYIEPLRTYLKNHPEIQKIHDRLVDGLAFKDEAYRWMTQDVIFVTARVYSAQKAKEIAKASPDTDDPISSNEPEEPIASDDLGTGFMAYEQHLEEYVIKNWERIDFGEDLDIYSDVDGATGQQYTTDVGIIDILAQDKKGDFVVIELKRAESGYKVVGQILNYMGWVQEKLATPDQKVRGLIIVGHADKTLRAALRPVSDKIALKEYRITMHLENH